MYDTDIFSVESGRETAIWTCSRYFYHSSYPQAGNDTLIRESTLRDLDEQLLDQELYVESPKSSENPLDADLLFVVRFRSNVHLQRRLERDVC